ncbi:MAG: CHAT domain-containing protein [Sphingobacteriia bacterium]|nr:CHAT domain-containing protein [Sphingobacteriia bacterium]NCC40644.1 CHAT domain-containing protein [Gammaproteobacteria bacterium]
MTAAPRDILITPRLAALPADWETELTWLARQYHPDPWQCVGPELSRLVALGERLCGWAFEGPAALADWLPVLRDQPVRLCLQNEDPALARLPWEYLCVPSAWLEALGYTAEALGWSPETPPFLVLHPAVALVRRPAGALAAAVVEEIGALRLLVVSANPACDHWAAVPVERDAEAIRGGLRGVPSTQVDLRILANATPNRLAARLAAFKPHLLHVIAHGAHPAQDDVGDPHEPALILQPDPGTEACHAPLTASALAALCARHGVRAVVLNSCWSGHGDQSLADALLDAGVAVVVAMQLPLPVSAAAGLAGALYEGLMIGRTFEVALNEYRCGCVANQGSAEDPDWGIPVLTARVADTALFRPTVSDPYPISFRPLIREYVPIVGRGFLFERIAQWCEGRRAADRGGVFLLTAEPGLGKTAFAAQWVQEHPEAVHYFFVQREGRSDPDEGLRSLYGALLGRFQQIDPEQATLTPVRVREQLRALLDRVVGPRCVANDHDEILLIDALDESALASDGHDIVALLPSVLPPRVHLLLTSRPGPLVERLARRGDVEHLHLAGDSPENLEDAARYAERRLSGRVRDLGPGEARAAAEQLAARTGGNFLVLRYLLHGRTLGAEPTLAAIEAAAADLGPGITGIYADFYARVVNARGVTRDDRRVINRLLGALVSAAAPVTRAQLCEVVGLETADVDWGLERVAQFLSGGRLREAPGGVDTVGLYHETFREFLLERLAPDLPGLHARWATWARGWPRLQGYARRYALRWLPEHQRRAGEGEALAETLLDYAYLEAALGADGGPAEARPRSPFDLVTEYDAAEPIVPAADGAAVRLFGGALNLCAHILAEAPEELPGQLAGRLMGSDEPRVNAALEGVKPVRTWLRPVRTSIMPSGGTLRRVLMGHTGRVWHVEVTGDGRAVSASEDHTLRVWDLASGACLAVLAGHTADVWHVALTGDNRAVSASWDHTLRVWDLASGNCLAVLEGHTGHVWHVALSGDSQVVSASADRTLRIWDLASGNCLKILSGHTADVLRVALTSDGRAVSASEDHTLRVRDLDSGACLAVLGGHSSTVTHVALTVDGQAVSASTDCTLRVWDIASGACLRLLKGHSEAVAQVALTGDGRAVSASWDHTLRVWDLESGACLAVLEGHTEDVWHLTLTRDDRVVSASWDHTLRMWDLASGLCLAVLEGHADRVWHFCVMDDGRIVSASEDRTLRVWDLGLGACLAMLEGHIDRIFQVAMSDNDLAVSASWDHTLRVWDLARGTCLAVLAGHTGRVWHVALTDEGWAVSASEDHTLRVWNLANGVCLAVLSGHTSDVWYVALTGDGQAISASWDHTLRVWDLATGDCLAVLAGHKGPVWHVALTGEGQAVSASEDLTLRVWNLADGACSAVLEGHTDRVRYVAMCNEGHAVSASWDRTLRVWDLAGGVCLGVLEGHANDVWHVAVTHDGRAICPEDRTLRIWDLAHARCLAVLGEHEDDVYDISLIDGGRVLTASWDGSIRVFDLSTGACLFRFTGDAPMTCCAATADGRTLAAGDSTGGVHLLRLVDPRR